MPALAENQAFTVDVEGSDPHVTANRCRRGSILETTMVFRTARGSPARVRAENASGIRINITGPKPGEDEDSSEATAYGRSPYNHRTSVTITHRDVNLALDTCRRRPLVRFVSVGPISEEDIALAPGEPPVEPKSCAEGSSKVNVNRRIRPVSAPPPSAASVTAMLNARPTARLDLISVRPSAPLRIITNPLSVQHESADSEDSPLSSPSSPVLAFRPHQFSGRSSLQPRRQVLDEPLPSLCPRSPSESSLVEQSIPEEIEEVIREISPSHSLESLEGTLGGVASPSLTNSIRSLSSVNDEDSRHRTSNKVISLGRVVKSRLYGASSHQTASASIAHAHGRSSMSPPPSAFQRFERSLVTGSGSSVGLNGSRVSLKSAHGTGKSVRELLEKAMSMGKGIKRTREEENIDTEEAKGNRPVAGRRTKRKLMGVI